jgi:hypothetical protein
MTSNHDHVRDVDASSMDAEVILPIMSAEASGTSHDVPTTGPLDEVLTSEGVDLEPTNNVNNQDLYTDRSVVSSKLSLSHKFQKGRRKTKPDDTRPQGEQDVLRPCHQGDTMYPNAVESSQHRQVIPLKRKVSTETSARAPESSQRSRRSCRDRGGTDLDTSSKSDHRKLLGLSHSQSAVT